MSTTQNGMWFSTNCFGSKVEKAFIESLVKAGFLARIHFVAFDLILSGQAFGMPGVVGHFLALAFNSDSPAQVVHS